MKVLDLCRIEKGNFSIDGSSEQVASRIFENLSREMEAVASQAGLRDAWKRYDSNKAWTLHWERALKNIRRTIARRNPEAMFRELRSAPYDHVILAELKDYGYDSQLVEKEMRSANRRSQWANQMELAAAYAFAWGEEIVQERRYREVEDRFHGLSRIRDWTKTILVVLVLATIAVVYLGSRYPAFLARVGGGLQEIIEAMWLVVVSILGLTFAVSSIAYTSLKWAAKRGWVNE
jgi:hypothetical protein